MEKPMGISKQQLDGEYRTVSLFIETAKTFTQLATGALLLSVTFSQGLTGQTHIAVKQLLYLYVPWASWLLAILVGSIYLYCAVKYLQILEIKHGTLYNKRLKPIFGFRRLTEKPWWLYAALIFFFYFGTISFAVAVAYQLAKLN